jgi:hypothetical protein
MEGQLAMASNNRQHNAAPDSHELGPHYAWGTNRDEWCGGDLRAAYVRQGSAGKWTKVGSICVGCGTYWRDAESLRAVYGASGNQGYYSWGRSADKWPGDRGRELAAVDSGDQVSAVDSALEQAVDRSGISEQ